jgi:DNA-binding response OmpR family regulator
MQAFQNKLHKKEHALEKMILVVEDDDSIGSMLVEALSQETPYKAMLVTDGFQALQAAHSIRPSLFITDYRLPRMDGIELYDKLRSIKELANTPAIIMSAFLPEEEVRKRQLVSLNKPFDLDELLDTIERVLKKSPHSH